MKKIVYGSGFFLSVLFLCVGFYVSYQKGAAQAEKNGSTKEAAETAAVRTAAPLDAYVLNRDDKAAVGYILKEENSRVVVYCGDGSTLFEYTDIRMSELPYELQTEIRNGKHLSGTFELYSFLENYSS